MKFYLTVVIIFFGVNSAYTKNWIAFSSDILYIALPAYVFGTTQNSSEDRIMFLKHYGLTMGVTFMSQELINSKRPDHNPDYPNDGLNSFPSGHASSAFTAPTFVQQRFGFEEAIPFYILAAYVGWTRVHLKRHHIHDIVGSFAVSYLSSLLLVDKKDTISVTPYGKGLGIRFSLNY